MDNLSKYTIQQYLYTTLDDAKSGDISKSIGISNTKCRTLNSPDYPKEIKFTSYIFSDNNIVKSVFATYSSSNKSSISGSVTKPSYTEAIMTYSGFGSYLALNTLVEAINSSYNRVTIYKYIPQP
jgi:hypothetical protein